MDVKVEKEGIILVNFGGQECLSPKDVWDLIQCLTRALYDWYNLQREKK